PNLRSLLGRLRDYSPAAMQREARDYRELERSLGSIDPTLLTPQRRVDHAVMTAQLAFLHYQLDRRYSERAVDTYVAEPFRGVDWQLQQMQTFPNGKLGDEGEWRLVITRLS